jgi:hypothetical protein
VKRSLTVQMKRAGRAESPTPAGTSLQLRALATRSIRWKSHCVRAGSPAASFLSLDDRAVVRQARVENHARTEYHPVVDTPAIEDSDRPRAI